MRHALTAMFRHPGHEDLLRAAATAAARMTAAGLSLAADQPMRDDSDVLVTAVTHPWLFLIPEVDVAVNAALQRAGAELLINSTILEIESEGHCLPLERPELVAEHIARFLSDLVPPPAP
ncbi:alpha/beta fold hydrolase [Rhodococcus sp. NPDC057014]|uniref:alpha/beta fold hydrolase n=1 Tax=Rhodococcus sp. NPDC057014 TaxID=3346000 RepID=UPI0036364FEA